MTGLELFNDLQRKAAAWGFGPGVTYDSLSPYERLVLGDAAESLTYLPGMEPRNGN